MEHRRKRLRFGWVLALGAVVPVASAQNTPANPTPSITPDRLDTRLIEAVQRRDERAVLALIADGVDVNAARADRATPLVWATLRDDTGIAATLLRAGADPNATDENGETPLLFASAGGNLVIAQLLLEAGH